MKISQIINETTAGATASGSISSVAGSLGKIQKRAGSLFKGKKTKKPFYEDEIVEQDLIIVPGMRRSKDTSFIPHAKDRRDHEVEMARKDLYAATKNAMRIMKQIQNRSEDEGLMGWQQSYITLASDYLNSVADSLAEPSLNELSKDTLQRYISTSSAAARGGREDKKLKNVPSWKVAAGKVASPDSVMDKYAKVKAGDMQPVAEGKRIARKPGQPANSKKHSDLYTDENPKGTITGLKFATADDARASVSKIRNSGRSHAHKIQAAVAMEQRAKAAGKSEAAGVYRKFINSMKKKTKENSYE